MNYNVLGISLFFLAGCSTQGNVSDSAPKNTAVTQKVQICIACHGDDGKSGKVGVPPLDGRSYEELVNAMQKVRDSYSPQPLLGHALSDEDISYIATYFSSFK